MLCVCVNLYKMWQKKTAWIFEEKKTNTNNNNNQ